MKWLGVLLVLSAGAALAEPRAGPRAPTPARGRPTPRDAAYPGVLRLDVDARDVDHKVMHVHERLPLPAGGGPSLLLYPQWESASHAPTLEANTLAGLRVSAGGRPLAWRRDPLDPFAYRVEAPAGSRELDIAFDYLSPIGGGPEEMTPAMVTVGWSHVVLYPAGWYARDIPVQASLRLPDGFTAATSLHPAPGPSGGETRYAATSLEVLADSPVYAGRHVRTVPLGAVGDAPVDLHLLADAPAALAVSPTT